MSNLIDPKLVRRILDGYALPVMGTHGAPHWARVLENGLTLAEQTGAHRAVVAHFAIFHDARRVNESVDPNHGRRGGDLAVELRAGCRGLGDREFELLLTACEHHTGGGVDGDVTVRTCWDADRLDLWRVYIKPADEFLCTDAAKSETIKNWSRDRSLSGYTPDYVLTEWLSDPSD